MATDSGLISDIEAAMVTAVDAIQVGGEDVFADVDHWRYQILSLKDWDNLYPFAYVMYAGNPTAGSAGNDELEQGLNFDIVIGTKNTEDKSASRVGSGTDAGDKELGCSQIRDEVIGALHNQSLSTTKGTQNLFKFRGDEVQVDLPDYYALLLHFRVDCIGV